MNDPQTIAYPDQATLHELFAQLITKVDGLRQVAEEGRDVALRNEVAISDLKAVVTHLTDQVEVLTEGLRREAGERAEADDRLTARLHAAKGNGAQ